MPGMRNGGCLGRINLEPTIPEPPLKRRSLGSQPIDYFVHSNAILSRDGTQGELSQAKRFAQRRIGLDQQIGEITGDGSLLPP